MFISRIERQIKAQEFKKENLTDLSEFTLQYDWSPFTFKDNYRHSTSWTSCDLMVLDIDNDQAETCTIEQAKELFKDYEYLIVTTKSHQTLKNKKMVDRFRVILPLSKTIVDKEIYKNTWYFLSNAFPFIDQQCKDFARFYYKSKDFVCTNPGKRLDPIEEEILPNALVPIVHKAKEIVTEKIKNEIVATEPLNNIRISKANINLVRSTPGLVTSKRGKFSRATVEFIANGAEEGQRNIACYKAAKDLQEQLYTKEEAEQILLRSKVISDSFTEEEMLRTIHSAYSNDPKYDPRGLSEKKLLIASSATDLENDPDIDTRGKRLFGSNEFDLTESGWRTGEFMGLVAAPGTGKSSVTLKIVKDIIYNNQNEDYIHFFFSLEMTKRVLLNRWHKMVGKNSKYSDRLFIIDNKSMNERISPQHIIKFVKDTCEQLGKKVGVVAIDHFMVLSNKIDTTIEPHFDIKLDLNSGRGKLKNAPIGEMCRIMHELAVHLDCFLIVQNQGTKITAGEGDTPLGLHAGYGAAEFAWYCDYMMTVWQPLSRVAAETHITATGWQYNKIREKSPKDLVKVFSRNALYYDMETGDMRQMNQLENDEFNIMVEKANALRKSEDKKEISKYQEGRSRDNFQRILSLAKNIKNEK